MVTLAEAHQGVFAWMAARSSGRVALLPWPSMAWLGLDFVPGPLEPVPVGQLVGGPSLEELRSRGYLGAAVLAYLAEVGWRDPSSHELQSKPEMLLSFSVADLSVSSTDFSQERLDEVQAVFALELTPGELVEGTLDAWRELLGGEPSVSQRRDLEALALLYGPEVHLLPDFPRLCAFYARDPGGVGCAVDSLDDLSLEDQEAVSLAVTGSRSCPALAEVLAVLGPEKVMARLRR